MSTDRILIVPGWDAYIRETAEYDQATREVEAVKADFRRKAGPPQIQQKLLSGLNCLAGQKDLF